MGIIGFDFLISKGFKVNFFPLDTGAPPIGGTYVLLSSTGSSLGYYCFFPILLSSASINSLISAPLFEAPPPN
jgi:hypothetical protein